MKVSSYAVFALSATLAASAAAFTVPVSSPVGQAAVLRRGLSAATLDRVETEAETRDMPVEDISFPVEAPAQAEERKGADDRALDPKKRVQV